MSKIRQKRTADQIHREMSELFLRELSDPRLFGLTITDVTIDRELDHADIYVNALGDESREKEVLNALNRATGFLRRELAGRLQIRSVPQLHFHWDPTLARAERVNDILDSLVIPPAEDNTENEGEV
jgi:ribosome-binding factor A